MTDRYADQLAAFTPRRDFFIGIDSDGCAFDTMELKHKECFIPNIIRHFGLQAIAKFAREAAEFVNLYSRWRGINRFPALTRVLDLLAERDEVQQRGFIVPPLPATRDWIVSEPKPANPALERAYAEADGDARAELEQVLNWSLAVNASIADMVVGVAPFPFVRTVLAQAEPHADLLVVSATPCDALEREWAEHDLARLTRLICGQEMGTKREHLAAAAAGRYPSDRILMIGDAPGDLDAARANDALFFPINPGDEAASWQRLHEEGLPRFLAGDFAGDYAAQRLAEFERRLPEKPPWKCKDR